MAETSRYLRKTEFVSRKRVSVICEMILALPKEVWCRGLLKGQSKDSDIKGKTMTESQTFKEDPSGTRELDNELQLTLYKNVRMHESALAIRSSFASNEFSNV